MAQKPKPITFAIQEDEVDQKSLRQEVKFIIEGGGKAIQTSFVRKNEEEFFEFLNDFNDPKNKEKPKNIEKKNVTNAVPKVSRIRKSIKSPLLKNYRDISKEIELQELCEEPQNNNNFMIEEEDSDGIIRTQSNNNASLLKISSVNIRKSKRSTSIKPE